jgi:hypothetical protein
MWNQELSFLSASDFERLFFGLQKRRHEGEGKEGDGNKHKSKKVGLMLAQFTGIFLAQFHMVYCKDALNFVLAVIQHKHSSKVEDPGVVRRNGM